VGDLLPLLNAAYAERPVERRVGDAGAVEGASEQAASVAANAARVMARTATSGRELRRGRDIIA
jgi:hypothetical protein